MTMTPSVRKLALAAHVTSSVGWLGALAVFLAHAVASVFSRDDQVVRAVSIAMGLTAWFVILPLSLASLVTGLVQALGTAWGLFRHYWVLFKLLLTAVATGVLLLKLGPIGQMATAATETASSSDLLGGLRTSILLHALGGVLVLLAVLTLAVYKPRGMTPYGTRKLLEQAGAGARHEPGDASGTPLWVQAFTVLVVLLGLMLSVMLLRGGHGPAVHL